MADQDSSLDFMNKMLDMQQEYMKNLTQAFNPQKAATPSGPFENWWSQFPKSGQSEFDEFFRNLSKMGQGVMQNPFEMKQQPASSMDDLSDWMNKLNQQFSLMSGMAGMAPSGNPVFDSINQQFKQQLMTPFGLPFLAGQQNQFTPFNPGNFVDTPVLKLLQNVFNTDERNAGEQLMQSLQNYQNHMMKFNHMMSQVGIDSLEALKQKIGESSEVDYEEVFKQWMDISQGVFNKLELGDEFKKLQGSLKEAEENLKQDLDVYRSSLSKNLGLVPRSEFDALKNELADLKKEIKKLK